MGLILPVKCFFFSKLFAAASVTRLNPVSHFHIVFHFKKECFEWRNSSLLLRW